MIVLIKKSLIANFVSPIDVLILEKRFRTHCFFDKANKIKKYF